MVKGRWASRAWWRSPAAMLVVPVSRSAAIARLRRAAMTCGPAAVRVWERSSSKETSRTQCSRFSMFQCPRIQRASKIGSAWNAVRLVIA
ncbi:hypothetical protein Ae706Ps2_6713c [Pseudonocardia sp. Ae706_Ps2]|nr:hypothetical protein Ae706Ps2_6713c [Pseudonocardia sp. Ae706_Ps2]